MTNTSRPVIGVTLDAEPPGGYSKYPWYALRANYMQALAAAGGLPMPPPIWTGSTRWWSPAGRSMWTRRCMAPPSGTAR
jgi:hypothetical protein